MRRVDRLTEAPTGLASFLTEFPSSRDWTEFREHSAGAAHSELLSALKQRQQGLCCYCENRLAPLDEQVEHFHPKSHQDHCDKVFAIENLMAACLGNTRPSVWGEENKRQDMRDSSRYLPPTTENMSCGQKKGESLPAEAGILDPRELPQVAPIVIINSDVGDLEPDPEACLQHGVVPEKVRSTISALGLNCRRLSSARASIFRFLLESYKEIETEEELLQAAREHVLPNADGMLARFQTTYRLFFGVAAERVIGEFEASPR
jgi:uncharacterized protein (TIGR02646 family)